MLRHCFYYFVSRTRKPVHVKVGCLLYTSVVSLALMQNLRIWSGLNQIVKSLVKAWKR